MCALKTLVIFCLQLQLSHMWRGVPVYQLCTVWCAYCSGCHTCGLAFPCSECPYCNGRCMCSLAFLCSDRVTDVVIVAHVAWRSRVVSVLIVMVVACVAWRSCVVTV